MNVPNEILIDVFAHLQRCELDGIQITCRRYRRVIETFMSEVCVRRLRLLQLEQMHDGHKITAQQSDESELSYRGDFEDMRKAVGHFIGTTVIEEFCLFG